MFIYCLGPPTYLDAVAKSIFFNESFNFWSFDSSSCSFIDESHSSITEPT